MSKSPESAAWASPKTAARFVHATIPPAFRHLNPLAERLRFTGRAGGGECMTTGSTPANGPGLVMAIGGAETHPTTLPPTDRQTPDSQGSVFDDDDRSFFYSGLPGLCRPGKGFVELARMSLPLAKDQHRGTEIPREREEMSVVQIVGNDDLTAGFCGGYDLAVIRSLQLQVGHVAPLVAVWLEKPAHQAGDVHVQEESQDRAGSTKGMISSSTALAA